AKAPKTERAAVGRTAEAGKAKAPKTERAAVGRTAEAGKAKAPKTQRAAAGRTAEAAQEARQAGPSAPRAVGADGTVQVPAELLAALLRQASAGAGDQAADGALARAAALLGAAPPDARVPDEARAQGAPLPGAAAHPFYAQQEFAEGLTAVMADHHVPGVALAVLRDGALADVQGHGVLAAGGDAEVTGRTLFQVGSISKHVTAVAVMRLVDQGLIDLDADVNGYLTSWRLADDPAAPGPLTVRQLLGHRAGLARHRSVGFKPGEQLPTLLDLLEGRPPVTTPRVRRELPPGQTFRKSSTHYWVLQQAMEDITGEGFEPLVRRLVLDPLGLAETSFDQRFPETSGLPVALGHDAHGTPLTGGWRNRAHLAAAGLWTTAGDIARLALAVGDALLGAPGALVTQASARELLAGESGTFYGLGTIVDDSGDDLEFGHGGEPSGYWNMAISRLHAGTGFVALTNADSGKAVVKHLTAELGRDDARFGSGRLAADWRGEGGTDGIPAVLAPVVTDEDRA
ncbi:serine hydrolase domain-containing protein, partial [Streptomyces sp. P17]|uniref:serine hydrolase domain-containing protein n=1 Tax=Streptomyces sp. P17 TaxID=3074716 RepID=UPI0028F3EE2D